MSHLSVTRALRAACGIALLGSMVSPTSAVASSDYIPVGTAGPYAFTIKTPMSYAAPVADTLIACKPLPTAGHFAGPLPAMMLIHGGGWGAGSNAVGPGYTGSSASWCALWASWGFNAFSVGYRLTREAPWPAQIVDVQTAIRWVRAHAAALNVNPALIGVNGDSAGGQLAMIAGYSGSIIPGDLAAKYPTRNWRPQLVISQFGPWTWGPDRPDGAPSVRARDYAAQLLIDQADGRTTMTTPITLFVQGTDDAIVRPCSQSVAAYRFLSGNDRPVSYTSYAGDHEFSEMNTSTWADVVGTIQMGTINFAYGVAHDLGVMPASEQGPDDDYATALPSACF